MKKALRIKIAKITVDILMLVSLIVTLATMRPPNLTIHTYAGFAFVGFFVVHAVLCRKWMIGITKNFRKAKRKIKVQYIINIILTLMWIASLVTGILILANVGMHGGRLNTARLHGIVSVIACVITVIHIIQHRKRLVALFKRKKRVPQIIGKPVKEPENVILEIQQPDTLVMKETDGGRDDV